MPIFSKAIDKPFHEWISLRDGPLENLWRGEGGGGEEAGEVQKKYSRTAKLNKNKFMHVN